jgi:putative salt-induced outer membrane protein YdiY
MGSQSRHSYITWEKLRMLKKCVCLFLLCCCCSFLYAAEVTLKNGDRISGTIVSVGDKKLAIKPAYSDPIAIDWSEVTQFTSDAPMVVTRTDNQVVSGPVTMQDSAVVVTSPAGAQTIPQADVSFIRSQADQAAYEKSLHPGILEGWAGGGNFGLALARGNSDTTNLALGFNADRKTTTDEWIINAAGIYSTSNTDNINTTTANAFGGSIRYDHNLTPRLFAFGLFAGLYDHLQLLNERISPNGGLGYHLIASKMTTLDILGGIGYTYENYFTGETNNIINATVGEELTHKFNATTTITERLYFYPYLNQNGNYRGTFDFGLASKFYRSLTWNLNFGDIYNSQPVPGKKDNDLLLTTGLGLTFGGKAK